MLPMTYILPYAIQKGNLIYLLKSGSEVHIDMFDDRVEITSPGGMSGGGSVQEYDIYSIHSMRRNPVISDLFHRMKYLECHGSGLRKIVSETEYAAACAESP